MTTAEKIKLSLLDHGPLQARSYGTRTKRKSKKEKNKVPLES
jgi:hypothetical protein